CAGHQNPFEEVWRSKTERGVETQRPAARGVSAVRTDFGFAIEDREGDRAVREEPMSILKRESIVTRLGLTAEELAALKAQGFVSCESRRGQVFFKLRFRINGKQRVCYLGKDLAVVEQVQEWLAEVQAVRKTEIEGGRLVREAGQKLRN